MLNSLGIESASADQEASRQYWESRLADVIPVSLPFVPRAHLPGQGRWEELSYRLPDPTVQRLHEITSGGEFVGFVAVAAAVKTCLFRYHGHARIPILTPPRHYPERAASGWPIISVDELNGTQTFKQLLQSARRTLLEAYQHQWAPIPTATIPKGVEGRADVSLAFDRLHAQDATGPVGISLRFTGWEQRTLTARVRYDTQRVCRAGVEQFLAHFARLLAQGLDQPDTQLADLAMADPAEIRRVTRDWNATALERAETRRIPERFAAWAQHDPHAIAVECGEQHLTYGELDALSNALASSLRAAGVNSGSFVPLVMRKRMEFVVAVLGVLKAGAAFVPLDLNWPESRRHAILEEIQPQACVYCADDGFPLSAHVRHWIPVPEVASGQSFVDIEVGPEDPIYAIYTSGSTGAPKAAVVAHRGIENRLSWMDEYFGRSAAAAAAQTTSHVYDGAVWQILWPLTNGGKTVLPAPGVALTAQSLAAMCTAHKLSILCFVPSLFNSLAPELMTSGKLAESLDSVRVVILGGEAPSTPIATAFKQRFPKVRLVSMYGPTEASIGCGYYEVLGNETGPLPLGRPISNTQLYLLDERQRPTPIGAIGEIHIAGTCLGRGYFRDKARTSQVFVRNPFSTGPADRQMYKTGDLGRWTPEGFIEFLGRRDHQVKLRGFRIELGEIENALRTHPEVSDAVVILREDRPGEKRLVGYVVGVSLGNGADEVLLAFLRERLPEHMVPATMVVLPELPVSSIGKVDRSRLPAPNTPETAKGALPQTPLERLVADVWRQTLNLRQLTVKDHFFDLGGHSISAAQSVAKLVDILEVPLTLADLFRAPTIEAFVPLVESVATDREALLETAELYFELQSSTP